MPPWNSLPGVAQYNSGETALSPDLVKNPQKYLTLTGSHSKFTDIKRESLRSEDDVTGGGGSAAQWILRMARDFKEGGRFLFQSADLGRRIVQNEVSLNFPNKHTTKDAFEASS